MNFFKKIPFIGLTFSVIVSSTFSRVITSSEYSESGLEIVKRAKTKATTNSGGHSNPHWIDKGEQYWIDSGKPYWIDSGEPYWGEWDSIGIPSSDLDKVRISSEQIMKNIEKLLENEGNCRKEGVLAIVERLLDSKARLLDSNDKPSNEKENYNLKFIAGVIASITSEGCTGQFENKNNNKDYLKCLNNENYGSNLHYENYSLKKIFDSNNSIGIEEADKLAKNAKEKKCQSVQAKFGFGICQWTDDRTLGVLDMYMSFKTGNNNKNKPSYKECIQIETDYFMHELEDISPYYKIYNNWKKIIFRDDDDWKVMGLKRENWVTITETGEYIIKQPPTPFLAGFKFCKVFEAPQAGECKKRANKAEDIYSQITKIDD